VNVLGVIEPGTERAKAESKSRKVVVIGTEATISSHAYQRATSACGLEAREKACPLLVPLVEEGWVDHPVTEQVARIYLNEAFADGFGSADVLLLGCTHYPLLKPVLRRVVPSGVALVDSAESMALAVFNLTWIIRRGQRPSARVAGFKQPAGTDPVRFFVTDS
jgi:glutamate racemase